MNKQLRNKGFRYLLLIILVFDLSYSFVQHYNMPLDGDLAPIVVPSEEYKHVLKDPFGIRVLTSGDRYDNPNRYFAHLFLVEYFKKVPNLLQHVSSPIQSVYLACAILKILVQLMLVMLLAYFISNFRTLWSFKFIVPAFLVFSLFQTMGYTRFMGIIDPSIVYTLAYAFPIALMLLFYIPAYKILALGKAIKLNAARIIWITTLAIIITLNGPLVPALIIIINSLIIIRWIFIGNHFKGRRRNFIIDSVQSIGQMPKTLLFLLIISTVLSVYSLALGMFNSQHDITHIPLLEYYSRIPLGLYNLFTTKLGWPILMIFIILNVILIKRGAPRREKKQILTLFKWILVFALIYIILLPLGGYRWYRPNAIRYDTFIPVTLACIYIFASSSYYLLHELKLHHKMRYAVLILGFVVFFSINDNSNFGANSCEIEQFNRLSSSIENPVALPDNCTLMSWEIIKDPVDSKLQGELIYHWNITSEKKTYYQVDMD